jgi:hypothetical protein
LFFKKRAPAHLFGPFAAEKVFAGIGLREARGEKARAVRSRVPPSLESLPAATPYRISNPYRPTVSTASFIRCGSDFLGNLNFSLFHGEGHLLLDKLDEYSEFEKGDGL